MYDRNTYCHTNKVHSFSLIIIICNCVYAYAYVRAHLCRCMLMYVYALSDWSHVNFSLNYIASSTDLIPIYVIFQCILHLSNEVRLIRLNML